MTMYRVFLLLSFAVPNVAAASVFEDCKAAVSAVDQVAAQEAAEVILSGRGIYIPPEQVDNVAACLKLGSNIPHGFSKLQKRFVPVVQSQIENRRYEREVDLREKEEQIAADLARIRAIKEEREQEVQRRLVRACSTLYQEHPDETITNPLCFDVFLAIGLPQ